MMVVQQYELKGCFWEVIAGKALLYSVSGNAQKMTPEADIHSAHGYSCIIFSKIVCNVNNFNYKQGRRNKVFRLN